ncbi:MAG: hypothetical protein ACE5WD_12305 [Candidatus Aminicenantia bacterium]
MQKATLAVKLDSNIIKRVKKFCADRGIKYGFFVEKALKEKLEREEFKEDLLDLKTLRGQEKLAIPFEEYLRTRRV